MRILVDTPIWWLALRRRVRELAPEQGAMVAAWTEIIREKRVVLVGSIRQEVLSGVCAIISALLRMSR